MNCLQFFTHVRGIGTNFSHMIDALVPIIHTRIPRNGCVTSNKANLSNLYPGEGLFFGQVWYLIVSIPDLCNLTYFDYQSCFVCAAWRP